VLGAIPIRSHLAHELVDCERADADADPEEPWERFYARRVLDRFG
jgi:hypothetical protein